MTGCILGAELVDWYEATSVLGGVTMWCGTLVGTSFVRG